MGGLENAVVGQPTSFNVYPLNSVQIIHVDNYDALTIQVGANITYSSIVGQTSQDGYIVTLTAHAIGNYSISVLINDEHISGSPFKLSVLRKYIIHLIIYHLVNYSLPFFLTAGGASPAHSVASGPGLKTVPSWIDVCLLYYYKQFCVCYYL